MEILIATDMNKFKTFLSVAILVFLLPFVGGCEWGSVDKKIATNETIKFLNENYLLRDMEKMMLARKGRAEVKKHIESKLGGTLIENNSDNGKYSYGFIIPTQNSRVAASLFFMSEYLYLVNILPGPEHSQVLDSLKDKSFDSVDATGGPSGKGKLYFLGLKPLSKSATIKIMLREDVVGSKSIYSINYVLSQTK